MSELRIENLHATVDGREILKGVTLTVRSGEVHAVMGPNGSGKSTLSNVLMGKPGYVVTEGSVHLDDVDLLALSTWERAQAGLYLAMQYPTEVPGVALTEVLGEATSAAGRSADSLEQRMTTEAQRIGLDTALLERPLNVDLSGGEKKRTEVVQLTVLQPTIAVLDEIDSGLDIDALRAVSRRIEDATSSGFSDDGQATEPLGVLAITHYNRLLEELRADHVHVFGDGRILESGGPEIADRLEAEGYAAWISEEPEAEAGDGRPVIDDPFFAGGTL